MAKRRQQRLHSWAILSLSLIQPSTCFAPLSVQTISPIHRHACTDAPAAATSNTMSIADATEILAAWDRSVVNDPTLSSTSLPPRLVDAVYTLNDAASRERAESSERGRCMLGICAADAAQGVATLKSWVTSLALPRGLLLGMDRDGKPIDMEGGVYIKYNSGGVTTFAEIRKRGLDAVWKPGDAMLEEYDGPYRGVYFQVELEDEEFRQYFMPLGLLGETNDTPSGDTPTA